MNIDTEVIPIAISAQSYNLRIANLVEHLLALDQKMFETDKSIHSKGAA
jgi:hypothetical protein